MARSDGSMAQSHSGSLNASARPAAPGQPRPKPHEREPPSARRQPHSPKELAAGGHGTSSH